MYPGSVAGVLDSVPGHVAGVPDHVQPVCRVNVRVLPALLPGCRGNVCGEVPGSRLNFRQCQGRECHVAGVPGYAAGKLPRTIGDTWESPICGCGTGPGTSTLSKFDGPKNFSGFFHYLVSF